MKHVTFKWLKRLWVLLAAKLIIIAVLLTIARFAINGVDDYKEQLVEWVAAKQNINVNAEKVSAGIDFSGLVLTLKDVTLIDTQVLPFELKIEHLFLHFDFIDSLTKQKLIFNDISLKGANLSLKSTKMQNLAVATNPQQLTSQAIATQSVASASVSSQAIASQSVLTKSEQDQAQSELTLDALKNIFLLHLSSFSITDSQINFIDHLNNKKTILIQDLSWVNDDKRHQGVGKASLPNTIGENTLQFVIDITGEAEGANEQLIGRFYAQAENLNATEYLQPQVNPLAELKKAIVSFELWSDFDFNGPKSMQLQWGNSEIAWSMLNQSHDWQINDGLLQFTDQDKHWLFDSYDLNITHNYIPLNNANFSGAGIDNEFGEFDLSGVNVNSIVPFALLFSTLPEANIEQILALELGGDVNKVGLLVDQSGEYSISANVDAFNNQAVGAFPGISDANISLLSNQRTGRASIKLGPQSILFDKQFSRSMPLQKGQFELRWENQQDGFKLVSDKSILVTDELDSSSQFTLFFPNDSELSSPFLSLFTYASLSDVEKAQYYLPMLAMGQDVFDYLQPTLKKGSVTGAKIVWHGPLTDYPYKDNDGVFQAFVPVKNGQYNFYTGWEGLSDLDLDLLFENDSLFMSSDKAKLGDIRVDSLSAVIDHLSPDGVLTINAKVAETSSSIADYLIGSPLKDSVGKVVQMIRIGGQVTGGLTLEIPLDSSNAETVAKGKLDLVDNDIDIELTSDVILPFKKVNGSFSFVNGDLTANDLTATLFEQPVNLSFASKESPEQYRLTADLSGLWNVAKLSRYEKQLAPLQAIGNLDWQGQLDFTQGSNQDYQFSVNLSSQLQGVKIGLPAPFNKNSLQAWPTSINVSGNQRSTQWDARINNKLKSVGEILHPENSNKERVAVLKYLYLGLGSGQAIGIDKRKQIVRITGDKINLTPWAEIVNEWVFTQKNTAATDISATASNNKSTSLFNINEFYLDIRHAELFEQPLVNLDSQAIYRDDFWAIKLKADNLLTDIEYRQGIPDRYDISIKKMNFQLLNVDAIQELFSKEEGPSLPQLSNNLREDYPEVFLECVQCDYKKMQLSPLKAHVYPSKLGLNIDYLNLGEKDQATNISGVWDQRRTNIIVDSKGSSDNSIVDRLGYSSPMVYEQASLNGALNWVGAPWHFNLDSLNGQLSVKAENGQITEVDDKGARLLSFLSLDGIRRSLNLEFGNIFSKGLGFDDMSLSANISNGILKNDDYFLNGSAGKISGEGLIDLPNLNVNYRFSYSPAVTSSLPVLAAFAINPLTGAAVLMMTKILEPVVDSIIRVDFSVKGALDNPDVKIEDRQRGVVKLQNSEVLEEIEGSVVDNGKVDNGTTVNGVKK
ncbi:YhdP family protein [Psychromonas arctica]|uniref:YhdP family protein n=1 Tax=Psychromonas arctica TaxID=168275 RepID=UPI0004128FC7|nr:YhdP family protein [Psychromonas arctica]